MRRELVPDWMSGLTCGLTLALKRKMVEEVHGGLEACKRAHPRRLHDHARMVRAGAVELANVDGLVLLEVGGLDAAAAAAPAAAAPASAAAARISLSAGIGEGGGGGGGGVTLTLNPICSRCAHLCRLQVHRLPRAIAAARSRRRQKRGSRRPMHLFR